MQCNPMIVSKRWGSVRVSVENSSMPALHTSISTCHPSVVHLSKMLFAALGAERSAYM